MDKTLKFPLKLITNFIYLSGAEIISKAATFAAVAYLARVAGPDGYGYLEFAGAVLLCVGLIVDQGFDPYGAREIAKAPSVTASLVSEILIARIFLAIIAYGALAAFAFVIHKSPFVTQLLFIYGISLFASPFLLRWVFQGHSIMQTAASMQVVRQSVYALVIFAFIHTASQIWIAGLAELAGTIGAVLFGIGMYKHQLGKRIQVKFNLSKRLFREGVPIGLSQMFWMVRIYGATVIIGIIALPQEIGFFGAAMRVFIALHAFIWLYFFNLLPAMSQSWQKHDETFPNLMANSLRLIAWASVLAGFLWVTLAPKVVAVIYGQQFSPAIPAFQWLAGVWIVMALSGNYRYGLIASGYQTIEMVISAIGAIAALILIPLGYKMTGINGAAVGLFTAEIAVWFLAWGFAKPRLKLGGHFRLLLGPLATLIVIVAILWIVPEGLIVLRLLLGLAAIGIQALVYDPSIRNDLYYFLSKRLPWFWGQFNKSVHKLLNRQS
jgi:PST family polysaccharide transporter